MDAFLNFLVNNSIEYISYGIFLYFLFKFILLITKVFLFKIIVKSLSYQYSETKKQKKYNKPKNNESKYRDIDLEAKIVDVEKIEDDLFVKNDEEKVIVGINKGRVLGKFTAMFAKRFMSDIMKLDINQIRNKGYFQAKILSERNSYEKFKRGR